MLRAIFPVLVLCAALLSACARDEAPQATTEGGASGEQRLPAPAGAAGGVTGMPARPGPGPVGPPAPSPGEDGQPLLPGTAAAQGTGSEDTSVAGTSGEPALEPAPDDAVAVLRDYHAALDSGDFTRAQAMWAEGSRASRQSPQQFAAAFTGTTGVSAEMMPPGQVEATADSRYIEIPVVVTATRGDGSRQRYAGAYRLRRRVSEAADSGQAAWRIASADLAPAEAGDAAP